MPPEDTNGTGTDTPQGTQDNAPKFVNSEQLNKAITARLKEFEARNKETILEALGSLAPEIDKMIEAKFAAPKEAPKGKVEEDPKYKGLEKQLLELKSKAESESNARAAAEAKAKDREMRQTVRDALASVGVDGDRARHALGFLVDAERRVSWSEDGESLIYKDVDGTETDFTSGIKRWAKSDEAKIYLPPRGTTGSGERPPAGKLPASSGNAKKEVASALAKLFNS